MLTLRLDVATDARTALPTGKVFLLRSVRGTGHAAPF